MFPAISVHARACACVCARVHACVCVRVRAYMCVFPFRSGRRREEVVSALLGEEECRMVIRQGDHRASVRHRTVTGFGDTRVR